jgi:hypothetical protein
MTSTTVAAAHGGGYLQGTIIVPGTNVGSTDTLVGMILWNDQSGATTATSKWGTGSVTDCWAPANESAAADLEGGVFGIAMNVVVAGATGLQVCIYGQKIPALMETTAGETSILAGAPLMIDVADDELISRAFAVTKTGLAQPIRFKCSTTQATTASVVNTINVDVSGIHPFGQFSGS